MAGAQRRVLHRDGGGAQALFNMGADLGGMGPDHHHDARAVQSLGRVDGVVQHGATAHRVQHLGQWALHARALPGGEDNGGA